MYNNEIEILAKTIADDCIGARIRLLNRAITNLYDRALQPLGLTVNQAGILVMLSLTSQAASTDIGKVLHMEKSTVSRNLNRMRKNGWIDIQAGDCGISQVVHVTQKGRALLTAAYTEWKKAQKQAEELLGEEGVVAVRKLHETLQQEKK